MAAEERVFYEFNNFRLDARAMVLYHGGNPVGLKPKTAETLLFLVKNAGEVVTKEDLIQAVWGDTFVAENSLSVNIYALRKAFAKFDGENEYIQTISRRGFRFNAEVRKIEKSKRPPQKISETAESAQNIVSEPPATISVSPRRARDFRRNLLLTALIICGLFFIVGGSLYALHINQKTREISGERLPPQNVAAESGTPSAEARDFYLRGFRLWQTRDNGQMARGIGLFKRAIEIDPNFADAYLGLADSYSMMHNNPEEWRTAKEYAEKAVQLKPDSADAHASCAFILAFNEWKWREAEDRFKYALTLNPNSGKAHHWYSTLLMVQRRFAEAETHLKRAIEIYPQSPNYNIDLAELYFYNRNDDFASVREQCLRIYQINPEFPSADSCSESKILKKQKRYDEVFDLEKESFLQTGQTLEQIESSELYQIYEIKGWRGKFEYEIKLLEKNGYTYNNLYKLGILYSALGDNDNALRILEKSYENREFLLPFYNVFIEFDGVREDSRFQNLMRRVGVNQN